MDFPADAGGARTSHARSEDAWQRCRRHALRRPLTIVFRERSVNDSWEGRAGQRSESSAVQIVPTCTNTGMKLAGNQPIADTRHRGLADARRSGYTHAHSYGYAPAYRCSYAPAYSYGNVPAYYAPAYSYGYGRAWHQTAALPFLASNEAPIWPTALGASRT